MPNNFLHNQLDFTHFVCGLAFLILGAACSILRKKEQEGPAWTSLGLFGLTQAINELSEMITLSFADSPAFRVFRIIVTISSLIFLFDFARRSIDQQGNRKCGRHVEAILLAATCLAGVYGWAGVDIVAHLTLGLAAGIFSFFAMRAAASRQAKPASRLELTILGTFICLFTVTDIFVDPLPSFLSLLQISMEFSFSAAALYGHLLKTVFAFGIAASVWVYFCRLSASDPEISRLQVHKFYIPGIAAFIVSVVAIGWLAAETTGKYCEQDMGAMLLTRTGTAASAIDGRLVARLSGSSSDVGTAEFKQLRRQLISIRSVNSDTRFVYLMGLRNGKVVFLADAEPENSDDYSPPGQEYPEASPLLLSAFTSGNPFLEGPFRDSWGTWVSGLVPVRNPSDNRVIALAGMDIDAGKWQKSIAMYRIGPILSTLFVCMLTIGFLIMQQRTRLFNARILTSERRFRDMFDTAPEGVFVFNPESHQLIDANPHMIQWLEYSRSELLALTMDDLLLDNERDKHDITENTSGDGGFFMPLHFSRCRKKDGTVVDVELTGNSLVHNGKTHILTFIRDVTHRKKAEAALQRSRDFYLTLFEEFPSLIRRSGLDGKCDYVNKTWLDFTGYTMESATGDGWTEGIHSEDLQRHAATYCEAFNTEQSFQMEFRLRRHDGEYRRIVEHGQPFYDMDGKFAGFISSCYDVTDHMKTREQLHHMQKMEAVGQLAGGIAHDFNNILTAIIGYASLLEMRLPENNPLRNTAQNIIHATERGAQLTRGLLAYSRKQAMVTRPVNLNFLIADLRKLLERLISEDIEIKTILTDEVLTVSADAGQLEQVLMNLATNARDAMPGGGRIIIETKRIEPDAFPFRQASTGSESGYALITVTDSGQGMHETISQKMFDPFFTTKEVGKGTGLGLSIVYGIVKQHGGQINVLSEPGDGTTFRIYLPLLAIDPMEPPVKKDFPLSKGSGTILVAEDDPEVRKLTCEMLNEFGYTCLAAVDGEDAVRVFLKHMNTVNLVLLDVVMPKMNGKEAFEKIREMQPDIKSVFMSGYAVNIIQGKDMFDEDWNFIAKPVSPEELLATVKRTLEL